MKYFFPERSLAKITGVMGALVFLAVGGFLIRPALADCSAATCSATPGTITISWDAAPATAGDCSYGPSMYCGSFAYYLITYNGIQQTTASPSITINATPNTVYSWSVDAYYTFSIGFLPGSVGYSTWILPSGSIDTASCSVTCNRCSNTGRYQYVTFQSADATCATVVPSINPVTRTCNTSCTNGTDLAWYQANCFSYVRSCTRCSYATPNTLATFDTNTSDCFSQADTTINRNAVLSPCSITNGTATCPSGSGACVYTCNAGYTLSGSTCVPNPPTCAVTPSPLGGIASGQSSILTWSTTNATSADMDNGVYIPTLNGSVAVSPAITTTYTLTVGGPGGTDSCSATVTVIPPPTCELNVSPMTPINVGDSATLTWSATNATSADMDNGVYISTMDDKVKTVYPVVTTTYTLTVGGPGGTGSCSKEVQVSAVPVPTVDLKVNGSDAPAAVVAPANISISWVTANPSYITGSCTGTGQGWDGVKNKNGGNDSGGNLNNLPAGIYPYTITCSKSGGGTISDSVSITVGAPPTGGIRGKVLSDTNGNGVADAGETTYLRDASLSSCSGPTISVSGLAISYSGAASGSTALNQCSASTGDAIYSVWDMPIGTYAVTAAVPSGWQATAPVTISNVAVAQDSQAVVLFFMSPVPSGTPSNFCGDGACQGSENNSNCPIDCPLSNNSPSADGSSGSGGSGGSGSGLSVSQPNYCVSGPAATFSWSFYDQDAGDTQSAYQVQVATNSGFSGPGTVLDTGKVISSSNSYAMTQGILVYNQTYYWRVRAWDNHDAPSDWANGATFTTPEHQYPTVSFSWSPQTPNINEAIQITDRSEAFGGATKQSWLWAILDATYLGGTNSSSQSPQVKFGSVGNKTASLAVMDSDGYSCSTAGSPSIITVRFPLPGWREVAP